MAQAVTKLLQRQIERLSPRQRRQLLKVALSLSPEGPRGTAGRRLSRFAGAIPRAELQAMKTAIEAGCEQIRADEW